MPSSAENINQEKTPTLANEVITSSPRPKSTCDRSFSSEEFNDRLSDVKAEERRNILNDVTFMRDDGMSVDEELHQAVNVHQFYPVIELRSENLKSETSMLNETFGAQLDAKKSLSNLSDGELKHNDGSLDCGGIMEYADISGKICAQGNNLKSPVLSCNLDICSGYTNKMTEIDRDENETAVNLIDVGGAGTTVDVKHMSPKQTESNRRPILDGSHFNDLATIDEFAEDQTSFGNVNNSANGLNSQTSVPIPKIVTDSSYHQSVVSPPPPEDIYTGSKFSMKDIVDAKVNSLFTYALEAKLQHRFTDAITFLRKAMYLKPNVINHHIVMSECFFEMCDVQSTILHLKRAFFLEPTRKDLYYRLAYIFYFQGQMLFDQHMFETSLEAFTKATEMNPDNALYHTRGLACLAALGRHGECLSLINTKLEDEEQKNNADLFVMRARLHQVYGNLTLVYYDVQSALNINPQHREALMIHGNQNALAEECKMQGMRLMVCEKYQEALQKFTSAININPSMDGYHLLRGVLFRKMSNYNSAIDDFLLALDKVDHDEESNTYACAQRQLLLTYNDFAVECYNKGFYEEAIVLLNKAIKGEKREKALYVNRGDCFFHHDLTFALQDYHQALEIDPSSQEIRSRISLVHGEFGVLAFQSKDFVEADVKFSLAIQYNPRICQHHVLRARSRYMLDDIAGAKHDLLMALLLDPCEEEILSIHARLFPGKSIGDVLASKAMKDIRPELEHLVSVASPVRLQPLTASPMPIITNDLVPIVKVSSNALDHFGDKDPVVTVGEMPTGESFANLFPLALIGTDKSVKSIVESQQTDKTQHSQSSWVTYHDTSLADQRKWPASQSDSVSVRGGKHINQDQAIRELSLPTQFSSCVLNADILHKTAPRKKNCSLFKGSRMA